MVALAVHQRHLSTGEDVLAVELSVDLEDLAGHAAHEVLVALAESLGGLQREVELVASGELAQVFLETRDHQAHARDEGDGAAGRCFIQQFVTGGRAREHTISHLNISILFHNRHLLRAKLQLFLHLFTQNAPLICF